MTTNAELRALAEKAAHCGTAISEDFAGIEEDWFTSDILEDFLLTPETMACGPYIAAANPPRIIELLDEHRQALVDSAAAQTEMFGFRNEAAALRDKLEIAMRALEHIEEETGDYDATEALAQLKEQP